MLMFAADVWYTGLRLYLFLGYIAFIVASQEYHRKGGEASAGLTTD